MNILVFAAHPDDEILGCGASLAKHSFLGDNVYIVIAATGLTSRYQATLGEINNLKETAKKAHSIVGVKDSIFCEFPDNEMDTIPLLQVVKRFEDIINRINPEIIYTHWNDDLNIDHQIVSRAVITATRPVPGNSLKEIRFFEIASSTEWASPLLNNIFKPNLFNHVSTTYQKKLNALHVYDTEMREFPHPRSYDNVKFQLQRRGSEVGLDFCEAFVSALRIIK